jgi:RNA polymerase sigma-70 factor (ECF subfamily)
VASSDDHLQSLVVQAQTGDDAAFAELSQHHGARLTRYLLTMTGDAHAADDLLQESLKRAFAKLADLRQPERFGSWLLSIACNACRTHLRQQVQRAHGGDDSRPEPTDPHHSALSSLVRREDAAMLALAIDRLPILLREAFVLFVVEGLPYTEIATVTDVEQGTLQVRVHRAKALLRQQLGSVVDTWVAADRS